jgi:protein-L-isoaspartate(D-aspartate) O-methyltransferase
MTNDTQGLIGELQSRGVLTAPALIRAFEAVDRADFVPKDLKDLAYEDTALPIAAGQTISQPYTVAFMLEHLQAEQGQHILEVGYGSGWQTALLAHLVGEYGDVYAMELLPALCEAGRRNLIRYPAMMPRVHLYCQSAKDGCREGAPFDRIIAAAEVRDVPQAWRTQLKVGGRMIYPHNRGLVCEMKTQYGFRTEMFPGFVFVPFV